MKYTIVVFLAALLLSSCAAAIPDSHEEAITFTAKPTMPPEMSQQELIINLTPHQYTYEDFEYDLSELEKLCGDVISVDAICNTPDGRKVYDIVVGDKQGENQIMVFGAIHAREYITSQLVMRQLCDYIDAVNGYGGEYEGTPLTELLSGVTVHFIPMSNPDGVTISQLGLDGLNNEIVKSNVMNMGASDYEQWKANANGVDLNRNFDAGWDEFAGSPSPSSERYKGTAPGSEPEAAAMIKLTEDYALKRTISYHTCGAVIYWYYKQEGDTLENSRAFAERISGETG